MPFLPYGLGVGFSNPQPYISPFHRTPDHNGLTQAVAIVTDQPHCPAVHWGPIAPVDTTFELQPISSIQWGLRGVLAAVARPGVTLSGPAAAFGNSRASQLGGVSKGVEIEFV